MRDPDLQADRTFASPIGTDAGQRVQIERHRLVWSEDAIEAFHAALGDHFEAELQIVLDAEVFFEMVEDQRVQIVDLDRNGRRAAAELPIVGDPMDRQFRRVSPDLTHREAETGRDVDAADHDRIEATEHLAAKALGTSRNVGDEVGRNPDLAEIGAPARP